MVVPALLSAIIWEAPMKMLLATEIMPSLSIAGRGSTVPGMPGLSIAGRGSTVRGPIAVPSRSIYSLAYRVE
jgi:hypothetical protein